MLPRPSRVLSAIDLAKGSHTVLEHAVTLARALGVELHVLHVEEPASAIGRAEVARVLGPEGTRRHDEAVAREQLVHLERCLEEFSEQTLEGAPIAEVFAGWHVAHDRPARAILEAAQRLDAGYVVAGLGGHGAIESFVVGSVAQQLVHTSKVPLVLVPLTAR